MDGCSEVAETSLQICPYVVRSSSELKAVNKPPGELGNRSNTRPEKGSFKERKADGAKYSRECGKGEREMGTVMWPQRGEDTWCIEKWEVKKGSGEEDS